ncbi:MAG: prolyl oligopeptidase family serine peptidase [Chitinophagaceae bacterium]
MSQQTAEEFTQTTRYLLYLPDGYNADTSQRWPLMMFLHGSGESGNDPEKVKVNGPPKLIAGGRKFPFLVVSPQAASSQDGFQPKVLKAMLDELKQKYRVDPDRVYLTGLSMGGFASWELAQEYPEEFAAVIPVCGGGDTSKCWKLRHMPIWNFHGALDRNVPLASSQRMVDAVRQFNPTIRFTIYPETGHNSWEQAYDTDSLYIWMLSQKKFRFKQVALTPNELKQFEGRYRNADNDSFILVRDDKKLMVFEKNSPGEKIEVRPLGADRFFLFENQLTEIIISRSSSGEVTGFTVYDRNKITPFNRYP